MSFFDTLAQMLVILFAIVCGYAANRMGILGGKTDQAVCRLILTITLPAMTIAAVSGGETLPEPSVVWRVLGISVIFYAVEAVFALVVPCLLGGTPGQKGVWRYTMVFSNVAFIGYPVIESLFGQEALLYAVIMALPFTLLTFTLGPLLLAGAKQFSLRKMFSPAVIAALISLVLALCRLRLPAIATEMLAFVGDLTIPLSLLFVGSLLAGLPLGRMLLSPRLWLLSVVRLLALPAALCFLLRVLNIEALLLGVAVVQMAMPAAVNGSLICTEYGGDAECMAQATFLTTLASILTIPAVVALLL